MVLVTAFVSVVLGETVFVLDVSFESVRVMSLESDLTEIDGDGDLVRCGDTVPGSEIDALNEDVAVIV